MAFMIAAIDYLGLLFFCAFSVYKSSVHYTKLTLFKSKSSIVKQHAIAAIEASLLKMLCTVNHKISHLQVSGRIDSNKPNNCDPHVACCWM